jgi:hypothetical protein
MVELIMRRKIKHRCSTCHKDLGIIERRRDIRDFANKYCDDECKQIHSKNTLFHVYHHEQQYFEETLKARMETSGYLFIKYKEEIK